MNKARVTITSNIRASVGFVFPGLEGKALDQERRRIVKLLDDAFAIEQKGSHFSDRVRSGLWDGRRHVFYADNCTFPTGLVKRVKRVLREAGYAILKTRDNRTLLPPADLTRLTPTMLKGITLRDDQMVAVRGALVAGSGLLWLATNFGKSECACAIMRVLSERRTLFLVHTRQLLKQARERIALRLGTIEEKIGIIGDGRFEPRHITVATVQSLTRLKGPKGKVVASYLKTVELLFGDEVHHAKSRTWLKLINRIPAQFRYGLSGTPYGTDDNGLIVEGCFGPVVARRTNADLIASGVSARPTIKMVEVKGHVDTKLDWHGVYREGITLNATRNGIIADHAAAFAKDGKPCLILVRELWHGDNIVDLLKLKGVSVAFVHGRMTATEVDRTKARFEAGRHQVLVASPIFDEGVDVPAIRALIIADGGQSVRKILQQIGRGLRRKDGDNSLTVVDFADLTHKWLAGHSQERLAIYTAEGFEIVT